MDEWKSENYIPIGINAGGIINIISGGFESNISYLYF